MADAKTEKQKVKEITDKLEEGLKELFESEKYKSYLSTMSKFHNYSFNNTLLIAMQKPEASLVAGYRAWQKNFNRHVNKGEKGIRILAPAPYKIKEERDKLDPVTGEVMLDKDGMPQTEEVEIKIPAFRAVSVFDISQTNGEPVPELEAKELLSTVEGYEDFIKAVTFVASVPVSFEDIPGDSKGFFSPTEKRIAVQEGMGESQTLKTMVHETAHSMLHDREVNKDILAPAKDRNTKEVEAESIAYTVCQHFGIETSEYSFGYIAGWSSGKDMKELKSSLDTIRRAASELITGIEEQLKELKREKEVSLPLEMMQEQEKESLLLIQDSDLSGYSLVNVRGMDAAEVLEALYSMNDNDRLSVSAYLESKGAWTTEIAGEEIGEFGEYQPDVLYITDANEIIDLKAEIEWNERSGEPVGADDVILKITHSDGFEVERITNKTPEEVQEIMGALTKLENKDRKNIHDCLKNYGADYIPIIVSDGRNSDMPQFNDFEINLNKKEVVMMGHLSPAQQAEGIINRLEFAKAAFSDEERSLIVNYAYKLNDMEKTKELAEHIYYGETEGSQGAALAVIDAQAEIDALPDPIIGLSEMEEYGYAGNEMLPLTQERALELFDNDLPVYLLREDGSETMVEERKQITVHEGIFGIEKGDWENEKNLRTMQEELEESSANKEAQLLYGDADKYGIYQLKDNPELAQFHFAGTEALKRRGIIKDNLDAIKPENYNLIYVGGLSELQRQSQGETLEAVYEKFNIDHPKDFKGHSLSVSDIVVLHENVENSAHFVDSFGFIGLPDFMREPEGVKEQDAKKAEQEEMQDTSGHSVQKYETEQAQARQPKLQSRQNEPEKPNEALEFGDVDDGDEIIDLGDEKDQVLAEIKKSLAGVRETEPDYDGLMEKAEKADHTDQQAQGNVVEIFKSKTNEMFHEISEMNPAEIEETVKCHVQAKLDESGIDAEIVDVAVVGSRCRGLEREGSDLDVVVELSTNEREDVLFDTFNDDGLHIGEVKVDINPITEQRTGKLEIYLPQVEDYLDGVREARDKEPVSISDGERHGHKEMQESLFPEPAETEVTLTVAECGEYHNLGEFYENIPTVEEAVAIWKQIPLERMNGIPAIGINIHTPETEAFEDMGIDILSGKRIDLDILENIPDIKDNPQAMEVIAELVAKLPEMEIDGNMGEKFETKVWEKRMPNLTPAEQLAVEIDRFTYEYDTALYHDNTQNMTENVSELVETIEQRDTSHIAMWLSDVVTEGAEPEETQRAKELLEKLAEYKPLAKIEEMEEQNYNMVDNVLNNGTGEKDRKEENKKQQKRPAARTSLKARLAEKKALVSGKGKDHEAQENIKNNQREM